VAKLLTVSQVADRLNVPPRKISDAFYQRKLDVKRCPVAGRTRLIPEDYVPAIAKLLTK
jgi:hypothetical protein